MNLQVFYESSYDFKEMEQWVKDQSRENGMSKRMYIESMKEAYIMLLREIMDKIALSKDVIKIGEWLDEIVAFRMMWTNLNRYDFERFLTPEER